MLRSWWCSLILCISYSETIRVSIHKLVVKLKAIHIWSGMILAVLVNGAMLRNPARFAPPLSHLLRCPPQEEQALLLIAHFDYCPLVPCYTLPTPLPVGELHRELSCSSLPVPHWRVSDQKDRFSRFYYWSVCSDPKHELAFPFERNALKASCC